MADSLAALQQRSIPVLTAHAGARLRDARKDQNPGGIVREVLVSLIQRIELVQRSRHLLIDGSGVHRQCHGADQRRKSGDGYR